MLRKISIPAAIVMAVITIGFTLERRTESAPADKVVGTGTAGRITKWLATDTVGDSGISEDANGHIGIGTSPQSFAEFLVVGTLDSADSAIRGINNGTGRGVMGVSENGIGVNGGGKIGVNGVTTSNDPSDAGVRGVSNGTAPAGRFLGDVDVSGDVVVHGTLFKNAGSFRIDHPLDPEHKYLSHSFVESPDMMNIYNGNITTDKNGYATVTLPNYFDALNRAFRYQLTVVGEFAQAIVASKISGNSFRIRTDKPNIEVSWQVTGVRKDKFAEENRIKVESDKPKAGR